MALELCSRLNPAIVSVKIVTRVRVFLPPCIFNDSLNILHLSTPGLVIQGLASGPSADPLTALPNSLQHIECNNCAFVNPTVDSFTPGSTVLPAHRPNWISFFNSKPNLKSLHLEGCSLSGPLPESTSAQLTTLNLQNNALTGTIPQNFLDVAAVYGEDVSLKLSRNMLSGSPPLSIIRILDWNNAQGLTISLNSNKLNGSIFASWLSSIQADQLQTFTLDLSSNELTGAISNNFLDSSILSTVKVFNLDLRDNQLSGTLPSTLLGQLNPDFVQQVTLRFSNNLLSGDFPGRAFFNFAHNSASLSSLEFHISDNMLAGTLPDYIFDPLNLPTTLSTLIMHAYSNKLTASVPSSFISNLPSSLRTLELSLRNNSLSGELPFDLLQHASLANLLSLVLDLSTNRLSGNVFESVTTFYDPNQLTEVILNLNNNLFSGSVPDNFCAHVHFPSPASFALELKNNSISGNIPDTFLGAVKLYVYDLRVEMNDNQIEGAFPALLSVLDSSSKLQQLDLSFTNNRISGALPGSLFAGVEQLNWFSLDLMSNKLNQHLIPTFFNDIPSSVTTIFLILDDNPNIGGSIPPDFFTPLANSSTSQARTLTASLRRCGLTGPLPSTLIGEMRGAYYSFDGNQLEGALPLVDILQGITNPTKPTMAVISAPDNKFTGGISLPPLPNKLILELVLNGNDLTSLTFDSGASSYLQYLNVASNTKLTGTFPDSLFASTSVLASLIADNTNISGRMVDLGARERSALQHLHLANTKIDFCSNPKTLFRPSSSFTCNLRGTSASNCMVIYPASCFGLTSHPPAALSTCTTSPPTPTSSFVCINGNWISTAPITTPTIVIPSGSTQTIVNSDIGSEAIVINGLGSTIILNGCANNLTHIEVSLTPEDIKQLGSTKNQTLLVYASANASCINITAILVTTKVRGSTCRDVKVEKSTSNGQLSGFFTVTKNRCNTWWIILVSVVAGVVVLFIFVVILLAVCVPSFRNCFRPYAKRSDPASNLK